MCRGGGEKRNEGATFSPLILFLYLNDLSIVACASGIYIAWALMFMNVRIMGTHIPRHRPRLFEAPVSPWALQTPPFPRTLASYLFVCTCFLIRTSYRHLWLPCDASFWARTFLPSPCNIPHYAAYGHPSKSVPNVSMRYVGSPCSVSLPALFMFRFTPVAAFRHAADAHFEAVQQELWAVPQDA